MFPPSPNNAISGEPTDPPRLSEDLDSACSTPYVSAPSSPGRSAAPSGYFFSAPASPMHYLSSKEQKGNNNNYPPNDIPFLTLESPGSFEFEFSSRFSPSNSTTNGLMSSADELFLNGQIRPMKLSSHLLRPQNLDPLIDLEDNVVRRGRDLRLSRNNKSVHRKARSMSPLRNGQYYEYVKEVEEEEDDDCLEIEINNNVNEIETPSTETTPSCSASSSRSSSSGRNSKKWIFLKDLLHRSKSEGRANGKERFWSNISFSPKKSTSPVLTPSSSRDDKKEKVKSQPSQVKKSTGKPANGVSKRRVAKSAHELHYTANRAQAEEMKRKTFLPYRQGLLGCLGFNSKGYGALNGLAKSLNPISSR